MLLNVVEENAMNWNELIKGKDEKTPPCPM